MTTRRTFGKTLGTGLVGALAGNSLLGAEKDSGSSKAAQMHVGCQHGRVTEKELLFKARHGVFNIDGYAPKEIPGTGWDLDDARRLQDLAGKHGVSIDAYHLPLSSAGVDRVVTPNIMLGKSPERDREIEMIQQMIQVASKTDVRALFYNTTLLPVIRTERTPGRGGSSYSTFDYALSDGQDKVLTSGGEVSVDDVYERIVYLLDRLLPVAEEYKVQLGNHIADPPLPVGYGGITRWNSPLVFEGIKRFAKLYDSPSHGFNLCLGSTAEGLPDPNREIHEIIKWVGKRKQIFNIHLRNIIGGYLRFQEVYPDNGDMDFFEVARTLRDVGYNYMVMPDHVPTHPDDPDRSQGFAFAYGYIKAIIQAVKAEVA